MNDQTLVYPWWAVITTWGVVNLVNLLQSAGYLSRILTGRMEINRILGYAIMVLAIPAGIALAGFIRAQAHWRQWIGLAVFIAFLLLMISVEYLWQIEFRSPVNHKILVPYLVLFFGSILLMGLPMFRMDRRLWLVTVATTVLLLTSMVVAMRKGVG
jgi:phosphatidylserine synthase